MVNEEGNQNLSQQSKHRRELRKQDSLPIPLVAQDIPSIVESLKGKKLDVTIYQVIHNKLPSEDLKTQYAKHELRTLEQNNSSFYKKLDWLSIKRQEREIRTVDLTLAELGPDPVINKSHYWPSNYQPTSPSSPSFKTGEVDEKSIQRDFFVDVLSSFPDVRGVDLWTPLSIVRAFNEGKIQIEPYNIPGVKSPQMKKNMTDYLFLHIMNAWRDNVQAYFIAKILSLYTYNKNVANLGHIGGRIHSALPIILDKVYGIKARVVSENPEGDKENENRVRTYDYLAAILPPEIALNLLTQAPDGSSVSIDVEKLLKILKPHLSTLNPFFS